MGDLKTSEENDETDIWYVCKYCGRGYREAKKLIGHKRAFHMLELIEHKRQKDKQVGRMTYVYPSLSGTRTQNSDSEPTNLVEAWANATGEYEDDPEAYYANDETNYEDTFEVPIIVKVETQSSNVQPNCSTAYQEEEHGNHSGFKCELCLEVFQSVSKLYEHQAVHSKKYGCSECTLTFDRLTILNAHMKSVHVQPTTDAVTMDIQGASQISSPSRTVFNGASFSMPARSSLKKTRPQTDSSNVPHRKSPICSKEIPETLFVKHQGIHRRANKEIRCKHCPFKSRHMANISRHVRAVHTVQHEHQCTLCKSSFQRRLNLIMHMASVHKCSEEPTLQNSSDPSAKSTTPKKIKEASHSPTRSQNQLMCPFCHKLFKDSNTRKIHVRIHTGEKPYQCKHCPHRSAQQASMKSHEQTVHREIPHAFQCSACSASYMKLQNLENHYQVHVTKPGKKEIAHASTKRTVVFPKSVKPAVAPSLHLQTIKQLKPARLSTRTTNVKMHVKSTQRSTRMFMKCKYCPHRAANSYSLAAHAEATHGKQVYQCEMCSESYNRLKNLEYHISIKHAVEDSNNPVPPDAPKIKITPPRTLQTNKIPEPLPSPSPSSMPVLQKQLYSGNDHFALIGETQRFVCNVCKAEFAKKNELEVHLRTHSTYFCKFCNYSSKKENYMTVHMQSIHKDELEENMEDELDDDSNYEMPKLEAEVQSDGISEKPFTGSKFVCKICDRSFKSKGNLESHSVVHSVEKPFACKLCNTQYVRKGDLQRHRRSTAHHSAMEAQLQVDD